MDHGVVEFGGTNATRAIGCLAQKTHFGPDIQLAQGVFSIDFGSPNRGSRLSVEFTSDTKIGGTVLRIEADGH